MFKNSFTAMIVTAKYWKSLFLFCLGLAIAAGFCMKWLESDLWTDGERFSILGLEMFYSSSRVAELLSHLSLPEKMTLRYHLSFDFAFMAGVYPGIAAICMWAREKSGSRGIRLLLYVLAILQLAAWAADVTENYYLFWWINDVSGMERWFGLYHFVVYFKWMVALSGFIVALTFLLRKKRSVKI
jgi:hypothetical protein